MTVSHKSQPKRRKPSTRRPKPGNAAKVPAIPESRAQTKHARLIALLRSDHGATIAELAQALAWQPHGVRGVMSGVLRKKLKLSIKKLATDGSAARYRIGG